MRSKVKVTGNEDVKSRFSCLSLWKVDWFVSNEDQSDYL